MTARQLQRRTGSALPAQRALGRAPDVARALEPVAAGDEHEQESHGSHRLLRPDKEIAAEVYGVLTGVLFAKPQGVKVTVSDGMVTLSGTLPRADLIPIAERLASEVDGVVTVTCKLTGPSRTPGI